MSESRALVGTVIVVLAFLACASFFASGQSIWVDETTQLRGLALPFGENLLWLMGRADPDLGVPPDRMPPLSYWLGSLWASVFGLSETAMRAFGIAAMITAAPALYFAGRQIGGTQGGLLLVAAVFSAPGLIIMAGEIRTYPVFFALSGWALWAYTRLAYSDPKQAKSFLIALTICAILLGYAHFFGVVAGCCLMGGAFLNRLLQRQPLKPVLLGGGLVVLSWAGLYPFVSAAMGISGPSVPDTQTASALEDVVRYVIRLLADPVFLANLAAFGLLLAATLILFLIAIRNAVVGGSLLSVRALTIAFPIMAAITGLGVLNVFISGFETLRPSYSIWLVPFLFALLTFAFSVELERSWLRYLRLGAALCLVAANSTAVFTLMTHTDLYSHGAGEWIAAQIDDPNDTLVIHHDDDPWGHSYFPVFHIEEDALTQVVQKEDQDYFEFTRMTVVPIADFDSFRAEFDQTLNVRTFPLTGQERAKIANGALTCAETIAQKVGQTVQGRAFCGMFGALLTDGE